jgi:uncharacterized membrane protein
MTPSQTDPPRRTSFARRIRNYLLTGLFVIGPTALSLWALFWLLNRVDNLLGQYLRFEFFDYRRIPGAGLLVTLVLLGFIGWIASWIGARSLFGAWEGLLSRIPGIGILYGSARSLGEALLDKKREPFRHVVLVPWPHPGVWRVGFVTGSTPPAVRQQLGQEVEVVFVPHTPNPASGFVHYVPRKDVIYLDWTVEEGLKVIISAGVVQPPEVRRGGAGR